jgi:hypothetical protein
MKPVTWSSQVAPVHRKWRIKCVPTEHSCRIHPSRWRCPSVCSYCTAWQQCVIRLPSSHRVVEMVVKWWLSHHSVESSSPTVNSFTSAGRQLFCEDFSLRWAMRAPTPCEHSRSTYDSFLIQLDWLFCVNNNAWYVLIAMPRQGHHILH